MTDKLNESVIGAILDNRRGAGLVRAARDRV